MLGQAFGAGIAAGQAHCRGRGGVVFDGALLQTVITCSVSAGIVVPVLLAGITSGRPRTSPARKLACLTSIILEHGVVGGGAPQQALQPVPSQGVVPDIALLQALVPVLQEEGRPACPAAVHGVAGQARLHLAQGVGHCHLGYAQAYLPDGGVACDDMLDADVYAGLSHSQ